MIKGFNKKVEYSIYNENLESSIEDYLLGKYPDIIKSFKIEKRVLDNNEVGYGYKIRTKNIENETELPSELQKAYFSTYDKNITLYSDDVHKIVEDILNEKVKMTFNNNHFYFQVKEDIKENSVVIGNIKLDDEKSKKIIEVLKSLELI